jgi:hypothetical protein
MAACLKSYAVLDGSTCFSGPKFTVYPFFSGPFYALWCSPVRLTVGDVPEARPDTATCIFSQPNTLSYRPPIAELMQVREQKRGCTDSGGVLHRRGY